MERQEALKKLEMFIHVSLHAKLSSSSFYQIDGDRICSKCARSKRRTLYMIISENIPVMLKCFRASCTAEFVTGDDMDATKARPITKEELYKLGFDDDDAIAAILNCNNLIYKKSKFTRDRNLIVNDTFLNKAQAAYIEQRCKFTPTAYDMNRYHITPNLSMLIEDNDIEVPESMSRIVKSFTKDNSITFECGGLVLSTRAINNQPLIQKSIMNVSKKVSYSGGYVIGDNTTGIETLVISEGIFDIINAERIFANFPDKSKVLYVATLGFNKTQHVVEHHFYKNIESLYRLVIFMDSDVTEQTENGVKYTYSKAQLLSLLKALDLTIGISAFKLISVVYNIKGKDCGDISAPILAKREDIDVTALLIEDYNERRRARNGKTYSAK